MNGFPSQISAPPDFTLRACLNKRKFYTENACLASIRAQAQREANVPKLYAYQCATCGFWHKTKTDPAEYRRVARSGEGSR